MSLEHHPAASIFPLMDETTRAELAEDIGRNGLREPGKTLNGLLLDGRNREAACELAGVPFETVEVDLDGDDPISYVVSLNVKRNNLRASQRAIAAAEAWDRVPKVGTEKQHKACARVFGVNHEYVSQARALVERDRDGADAVKTGTATLAETYNALRARELERETRANKLERLRGAHPDLGELVDMGTLTLDEALAAGRERDEKAQQLRAVTTRALVDLCVLGSSAPDRAGHDAANYDPDLDATHAVTAEALRVSAAYCSALADELERKE